MRKLNDAATRAKRFGVRTACAPAHFRHAGGLYGRSGGSRADNLAAALWRPELAPGGGGSARTPSLRLLFLLLSLLFLMSLASPTRATEWQPLAPLPEGNAVALANDITALVSVSGNDEIGGAR